MEIHREERGLKFPIFELSKICMKAYRLVYKYKVERLTICPLQTTLKFNHKPLPFYFNFECTHEIHPIISTKIYVFVDGIVLLEESKKDLNERLEIWI